MYFTYKIPVYILRASMEVFKVNFQYYSKRMVFTGRPQHFFAEMWLYYYNSSLTHMLILVALGA